MRPKFKTPAMKNTKTPAASVAPRHFNHRVDAIEISVNKMMNFVSVGQPASHFRGGGGESIIVSAEQIPLLVQGLNAARKWILAERSEAAPKKSKLSARRS
jgi:hypothetical protein